MQAIITVGLGYGDEGKGATVAWLTDHFKSPLVVRYSGGAQCGHNVVAPNGEKHTFSQWGAGTFQGARTFLDRAVIVDPLAMKVEARVLESRGVENPWSLLSVHPNCLLTTPLHRSVNQLRELSRTERHGSCGVGIGYAREYWLKHGFDAPVFGDLLRVDVLEEKLRLLQYRARLEFDDDSIRGLDLHSLSRSIAEVARTTGSNSFGRVKITPWPGVLAQRDDTTIIFEGAQGVLLDEHCGTPPHNTWSDVTPREAFRLCSRLSISSVYTLGVTRTYATRHGAGPLPGAPLPLPLFDDANKRNQWQGEMRFATLTELQRGCNFVDEVCGEHGRALDGLVVNCVDEHPIGEQFSDPLLPPIVITGHGPGIGDRKYHRQIFGGEVYDLAGTAGR